MIVPPLAVSTRIGLLEKVSYRVASGADDVLGVAGQLWRSAKDAEFPGLGMGNNVGSARVRRAWAALVRGLHSAAVVSSFFARFLQMSLRGLRGALLLGWHVKMATTSSV